MNKSPEEQPILIIEDDENDAMILQLALRRNKVAEPIAIVSDGIEALRYLRGEPPYQDRKVNPFPKVIFTDLKMPGLDGFGVLAWLQGHPECSVIPTIVLSSSGQDRDIRQAYALGANSYIIKPNGLEELTRVLGLSIEYWNICAKPATPQRCG